MLQKYIAFMLTVLVVMIGYGFYWVHKGGIDNAVYGGLYLKESYSAIADGRALLDKLNEKYPTSK